MSLLVFLVILGVLILVHEWGHFISAKKLGIGVEVFSIGFGPRLFSKKLNGTEFTVSAIPLGGYVKLTGDERSECKGRPDEFFSHPIRHRAAVILMGPIVNFLFAYLCFFFLFSVTGYPILDNHVGEVLDGYPAYAAGFLSGDRVIKINETEIHQWGDLQETVFTSEGRALDFTVQRAGQEVLISNVVPALESIVVNGEEETYPIIGLKPQLQKYGVGRAALRSGQELGSVIALTIRALYRIVTGEESAENALAGPLRIFDIIRGAMFMGFAYLILIVGIISTSLGFFNLFPVPVLDGGHLAFLALEGIRGRPLPPKVEEGFVRVGFSLLVCLMVFVVYNDMVQMGLIDRAVGFFRQIFWS